jgi:hypothetical protein
MSSDETCKVLQDPTSTKSDEKYVTPRRVQSPPPYKSKHVHTSSRDKVLKKIVFGNKEEKDNKGKGKENQENISPPKTSPSRVSSPPSSRFITRRKSARDKVLMKIFHINEDVSEKYKSKDDKTERSGRSPERGFTLQRRHSARDRVLTRIIFGDKTSEQQHPVAVKNRRASF